MTIVIRIARAVGTFVLWTLTVVGACSLIVWGLNAAGFVQPLIVTSGSMEPGIRTGDLLVATPTTANDVAVGDVITVRSDVTDRYVTHRVAEIFDADGEIGLRLKGDANSTVDLEEYVMPTDARIWQPRWTIAGGGEFVLFLTRPLVAVLVAGGMLVLTVPSLIPARRQKPDRNSTPAVRDEVLT